MLNKLVEQMKFFTRLEAYGFAGCDAYFGSGTRIPADSGLARAHVEHAKSTQFNPFPTGERLLHAVKDGVHGGFCLRPWQSRTFNDTLDKVLLDQKAPSLAGILTRG